MFVTSEKVIATILTIALATFLSACPNWSKRNCNTAIGAGVGALDGVVPTGGNTLSTLSGVTVGDVISHQVGK